MLYMSKAFDFSEAFFVVLKTNNNSTDKKSL